MNKKELKEKIKQLDRMDAIYTKAIMESEKSFRELNSQNMQAVLIQFEDYLDSNHLYAFKNWFDGVVWDGPNVRRYWVDMTLKYSYEQMPEPKGALRLVNTGAVVSFKQSTETVSVEVNNPEDLDPVTRKPREETKKIWLVNIKVPRHFIENAVEDDYEKVMHDEVGKNNHESEAETPAEGLVSANTQEGGEEESA